MTAGERSASMSDPVSFDSGIVKTLFTSNQAGTGSTRVTVFGDKVGVLSLSSMTRGGHTSCEETTWNSETSISCMVTRGGQRTLRFAVTSGGLIGSMTEAYTYDVGYMKIGARTQTQECWVVRSRANITSCEVTFLGVFGPSSWRMTAHAGSPGNSTAGCGRSDKIWDSAVVLHNHSRGRVTLDVDVQLMDQAGCCACKGESILVFVTLMEETVFRSSNHPSRGFASMTVRGVNLGLPTSTENSRVGGTAVEATEWISTTVIRCKLATGIGRSYAVVLTTGVRTSSVSSGLSFDSPYLKVLASNLRSLTGNNIMTVVGVGFGTHSASPRVKFGDNYSSTAQWTSDSSLTCRVPRPVANLAAGDNSPCTDSNAQTAGSSCRADQPVYVELGTDSAITSALRPCASDSRWIDTLGRTCSDYALNTLAIRNTYDCSFTDKVLTAGVGALTDGVGPYRQLSHCSWIIAPPSAVSVSVRLTEFDVRDNDGVRVYECLDSSCSSATDLGCAGCAEVSTTCESQAQIRGWYYYLQECNTTTSQGLSWDSCGGRPAYANSDQSFFIYFSVAAGTWYLGSSLGSTDADKLHAKISSSATSLTSLAASDDQWQVRCNGVWVPAGSIDPPGIMQLQTSNDFGTLTSTTSVLKVEFVTAAACNGGTGGPLACERSETGFAVRFASSRIKQNNLLDPNSYAWTNWCHDLSNNASNAIGVTAEAACCECKNRGLDDLRYEYDCPDGYIRQQDSAGAYCQV